MEKRISVISIIVYEREQAAKVNAVLHEYADYIIGRMGLPYEKKVSLSYPSLWVRPCLVPVRFPAN